MSRKISIHEAAEIELNDAADFYDIACVNPGSVFIDEVQRTIKKISEFPDAAPVIRGQIRKKLIAKFSYSVIYSVRLDESESWPSPIKKGVPSTGEVGISLKILGRY
jgi:hypothetical protein